MIPAEIINYRKEFIRSHPEMTNRELAEYLGVCRGTITNYRGGTRHAIDGGTPGKGARGEVITSRKLDALGISHKLMPHMHPFDIQFKNGLRGDVKSAFKVTSALVKGRDGVKKFVAKFYQFKIVPHQDALLDFYIFLIVPTLDFFVVPAKEASSNIRISVNWKDGSKWAQYHNRFDLISKSN